MCVCVCVCVCLSICGQVYDGSGTKNVPLSKNVPGHVCNKFVPGYRVINLNGKVK